MLEYLLRKYAEEPNETGAETAATRVEAWPYGCRVMICNGYLPYGSGASNLDGREVYWQGAASSVSAVDFDLAPMPWLVGAISRMSGETGQKTMLGIERFLGGKLHFLTPLGWIETKDNPRSDMGLLSCCRCGPYKGSMAVGYESDGKYRACVVYLRGSYPDSPLIDVAVGNPLLQEPVCGPDVELTSVGTEAALVEYDRDPALIYHRDGNIYLQRLKVIQVAAPTKSSKLADALAATGGSSGDTVKIVSLPIPWPRR